MIAIIIITKYNIILYNIITIVIIIYLLLSLYRPFWFWNRSKHIWDIVYWSTVSLWYASHFDMLHKFTVVLHGVDSYLPWLMSSRGQNVVNSQGTASLQQIIISLWRDNSVCRFLAGNRVWVGSSTPPQPQVQCLLFLTIKEPSSLEIISQQEEKYNLNGDKN